ncbi:MAG TPA: hypothetical protein PK819_13665, partial [Thermomicrobiales bacterium]|nr:hypothetical protein [Thermomicrobiales bacterium]
MYRPFLVTNIRMLLAVVLLASGLGWVIPAARPVAAAAPVLRSVSTTVAVNGGGTVTAKVTLSARAPAGGIVVSLKSNRPSLLTWPATVTVAAGARTASYAVLTTAVTQDVTITTTAKYGGVTVSDTTLLRAPKLSSVSAPTTIKAGASASVSVRLNMVAPPAGMRVALKTSRPSILAIPASVHIPGGYQVATVTVTAVSPNVDVSVTITATMNGISVTDTLTVQKRIVPTATRTRIPTRTATRTQTATNTLVPPTETFTPVPPTDTHTAT